MPSDARLLLIDAYAVQTLLRPADVFAAVRESFALHSEGEGRGFPVVREHLSSGGVFGIKSGDVGSQGLLGFKAAGFWPGNRSQGGEPHQATILLFDPGTGRPKCVIDGNAITTARTGAAGGVGIQLLARPESRSLCIFGSGVQARVQLETALRVLAQVEQVRYLTRDGTPDLAFETYFAKRCRLIHATDPDAAVASSDIVITATPGKGALFSKEAVRPGTHINCVGTDTQGKRELPEGLLETAFIVVDDEAQARSIGECQWQPEVRSVEIGHLVTGKIQIDRPLQQITIFDMTGLALQDLTVARLVQRQALARGVGTTVAWPW